MARSMDGLSTHSPASHREARRPPGSLPKRMFQALCDSCGQCGDVCPKGGIVIGRDGYPVLVTSDHNCRKCHLCSDVCTRGALAGPPVRHMPSPEIDRTAILSLIRSAAPKISARVARRS